MLGHRDARNKECFAHTLNAKERKDVLDSIFKEAVEKQVEKDLDNGELLIYCFYLKSTAQHVETI